jgi:dipeptidyl aminopeptidase/acylaminoacyl peptidase
MPVTDGRQKVDKPRFSPDGKSIYFTRDDDGSRVIRAVRFDPRAGQTQGDSFTVFDPDQPRLTLFGVNPRSLEIGIAQDKLVMLLAESASNLWVTVLEP